jgi:eukaryotic-like serine/threonine-protein kinase
MVSRTFPCDPVRLKSFLDDDLPEREQVELNDHLETCADCQRALERLAARSGFWGELRQLTPRLGGRACSDESTPETAHFGASGRAESLWGRDQSLGFLASSDDPGSLGRLGPYEVTELLGRGGFGVVFKAFDPTLGRAVAIKVLAPQLATSAAARSRFAREARAAAAVVHDHVVAIHAVDSWNGLPYLVMPFIPGQSLQERVDRDGPMDLKQVLRIGIQTAQGLESAHAQGLVHRDVKPSNILLENGVERVKLTDFGLARAVDDASLTQSGVVAGTPQYMSPEQARGEPVDHRSDIFSLGSVIYFMCAGHAPFRASSTPAVLRRVSDEQPRPIREINPDVPIWLAEIIERLHAKSPGERFGSAGEVAELLERILAAVQRGLPVLVAPRKVAAASPTRFTRKVATVGVLSIAGFALAVAAIERKSGSFERFFNVAPAKLENAQAVAIGDDPEKGTIVIVESSDSEPIVGSGKPVVKTWDVAGFSRMQIHSTFHATVSKGKTFKVTTTADDNVIPFVKVEKVKDLLKIGLEPGHSFRLKKPLEAEIVLPALEGLELSGACQGELKGFDSEKDVEIHVSGSSKLKGSLDTGKAKLGVHGASSISLTGSAQSAQLSVHGSSHLMLPEFLMKQGDLKLDGASTAEITLRSTAPFVAKVSGSSRLDGKVEAADIDLEIRGASEAKLRGSAKNAKIVVEGSSRLKSPELVFDAKSIELEATGASSAALKGTAETAVFKATGACHLVLEDLKCKTVDVTLSGASHASVAASALLEYHISSVSHLTYSGDPAKLEGEKTGSSHLSHK